MKKILFIVVLLLISFGIKAQNVFPSSGNVGIGTTNPVAKLHIDGINGTGLVLSTYGVGNIENPISRKLQWLDYLGEEAGFIDLQDLRYNTYGSEMVFSIRNGSNQMQEALRIHRNGNIGIGTKTPIAKLHIDGINGTGLVLSTKAVGNLENPISRKLQWLDYLGEEAGFIDLQDLRYNTYGSEMVFSIRNGSNQMQEALRIHRSGNVGIGTTDPGSYTLAVEGKMGAREIVVTEVNPWPDFVFQPNYALPTLEQVEQHIKTHGHLQDVPSEKEVKENGLNLGQSDAVLLQKIEELTLYAIEQNKKTKGQSEKIKGQEEKIKGQSEKIKVLEKAKVEAKAEVERVEKEAEAKIDNLTELVKAQQEAIEELKKEIKEMKNN